MDLNDIKVGDVVRLVKGAVHTVGEIYSRYLQYDLESTDGVSLNSLNIEKRLNKYHVGNRVILKTDHQFKGIVTKIKKWDYSTLRIAYEVKWDSLGGTYIIYEEDIIAMDEEKKINFEVGDYVRIDSGKISSDNSLVDCCGYLGIIVGPGYSKEDWKVYFFALKRMYRIEEKFLTKSRYNYTIQPKVQEKHNDLIDSLAYNIKYKAVFDSYYGINPAQFIEAKENSKSLRPLKEMYREYIKNDINTTKLAFNYIYGRHFDSDSLPKIKKVIFNGPATIVLWADGDKTVVHCSEGDTMDKEKGLAMAICKKALGKSKTHYDYYNVFKKWIKEK